MSKLFFWSCMLVVLSSCTSYRMLDGRSRPVFFDADSSLFNDTPLIKQSLGYDDLRNLRGNFTNSITIEKGHQAKAIVHGPTFFNINDLFLVYPGEHILISKTRYNEYTFIKRNGNKRRNRELLFFKVFAKMEHYPFMPNMSDAPLDLVLGTEAQLIEKIRYSYSDSRKKIDSLLHSYRLGKRFKVHANAYWKQRYLAALFSFYKEHKDTLLKGGLYQAKCRQLIDSFNMINDPLVLNRQSIPLNELIKEYLPYKLFRISTQAEFMQSFDTIVHTFKGFTQQYLLSQLMFFSHKNSLSIPETYQQQYQYLVSHRPYREIIDQLEKDDIRNQQASLKDSGNTVTDVLEKRFYTIESVLEKYKGKVVLVDFWASWCAPCLEEIPFLKVLRHRYTDDQLAILSFSLDADAQLWRKASLSWGLEKKESFRLVYRKESAFLQRYHVDGIPRYMLIDRSGNISNNDAPRPSSEELTSQLNVLIERDP